MHATTSAESAQTVLAEYETAAGGYALTMLELIEGDLAQALEARDTETAHTLVDVATLTRERYL